MRLKVSFIMGDNAIIPSKDYRLRFLRVLKKAFELGGVTGRAYLKSMNDKAWRPFSFSVFLGNGGRLGKTDTSLGFNPHILFSTGDLPLFTGTVKGFQKLRDMKAEIEEFLELEGGNIQRIFIELLPPKRDWLREVRFRTCGVAVLSYVDEEGKLVYFKPLDGGDRELFEEVLNRRIRERLSFLKKVGFSVPVYEHVNVKSLELKPTTVYREKENESWYVTGFRGKMKLSSTPEMLKFIYDYGIGVKTGQGFGLLEIERSGGEF